MRSHKIRLFISLLVASVLLIASPTAGAEESIKSQSISGTKPGYQTVVDTHTEGELDAENLRQASLLTSQIVMHVNTGSRQLEEQDVAAATREIDKALTLAGVVRELLPVTTETTVVTGPNGEEVYRHEERIQDDLIPIYDEMVAVEVVQPIVNAKQHRAAVEGVRLADVDLIHTSVLVDLGYVERRLRAAKARPDPADAREELRLAQAAGVRFSANKRDTPLAATLRALRLAERMAESEQFAAAEANLAVARDQLALYRGLVPEGDKAKVDEVQGEIDRFARRLEQDQRSAGVIRGFWTRVSSWMSSEAGQPSVTAEGDAQS